MKTLLVILFLLLPINAFADPLDDVDKALLGLTALSDFGDYQTSASIPSMAEHGYPNEVEGNPLIARTFGTALPSNMQYAGWFVGEYALQSATAYVLPPQWREAAMGAFIGIGSVDVANNSLINTQYGGGGLSIPINDPNSQEFSEDKYNSDDLILWSGFVASEGLVMMQDFSQPNLRSLNSQQMLMTGETIGIVSLIAMAIPQEWRDALFGYEIGINGAFLTLKSYH